MPNWTYEVVNYQPWNFYTSQEAHDNAQLIWEYFRARGFTEEACAGILGNMSIESFVNPGQIGLGYPIADPYSPQGLIMWTTTGGIDQLHNYATAEGTVWYDGTLQCKLIYDNPNDSIFWPRNGYYYTWAQFAQLTDVDEATLAFCWEAEAPGTPHETERKQAAAYWFQEFTGHQPGQTLPLWMMGGREVLRRLIIHA